MSTVESLDTKSKTPDMTQKNKSYPSVEFVLVLDTDEAQMLARTRLFKASKYGFTLHKLLNRYIADGDASIRGRALSLNHTLELVLHQASQDIDTIEVQLKTVIDQVKAQRIEQVGKDTFFPLTYSNPTKFNVHNRTHLGQLMCEKLVQIDNIYKNLDFCRHYNLVPLVELIEVEKNASKRLKTIFSSIIRHTNTMTRIVKEFKDVKYNNDNSELRTSVEDESVLREAVEEFDSNLSPEKEAKPE